MEQLHTLLPPGGGVSVGSVESPARAVGVSKGAAHMPKNAISAMPWASRKVLAQAVSGGYETAVAMPTRTMVSLTKTSSTIT